MGRTIDITESQSAPVTCVKFTDCDGDSYWIHREDTTILALETDQTITRLSDLEKKI